MKRKLYVLFFGMIFSLHVTNAQSVVVGSENFDGVSHTFTAKGWEQTSEYSVSGVQSIYGEVPFRKGDSIILTSPWYDFTNYGYISLRFFHICKIATTDIVKIQFRVDAIGQQGQWKDIPANSYLGNAQNFKNKGFNATSYSQWQGSDSLAIPTQNWWQEELFDLSNQVSYDRAQIRFILQKATDDPTEINYGWLIDNITVIGSSSEIREPMVQIYGKPIDTVYYAGPYTINAKVATRTPAKIVAPTLYYTVENAELGFLHDSIVMTNMSGDSLWLATIPQYVIGTKIHYLLVGKDTVGNMAYDSGGFVSQVMPHNFHRDSIMVGTNTNGIPRLSTTPLSPKAYYCSKVLYLDSMIAPERKASIIKGMAFVSSSNSLSAAYTCHIKIYLKATDLAFVEPHSGAIDPIAEGATEVYDGFVDFHKGWNSFYFDKKFILPAGKNLIYYVVDNNDRVNSCATNFYWCRNNVPYPANTYAFLNCNATAYSYSANALTAVPTTMFYFDKDIKDSNSVAMLNINIADTVVLSPALPQPIMVQIQNLGTSPLTSAVLGWSLNGMLQDSNIQWSGNLSAYLNSTPFQIGTYHQRLNENDTIKVWVNMPNGIVDTNRFDDTLTKIVFGSADIVLSWTQKPNDTVYYTGPHDIELYAFSKNNQNLPNLSLIYYYTDTNDVVLGGDTLPLTNNGNIYKTFIPNIPYYSKVYYSVSCLDYLNNASSLAGFFYIDQQIDTAVVFDNSVSLDNVVSPLIQTNLSAGNYPIKVVVHNRGKNNLTSCVIGYTIDGQQTPIIMNWIGNLLPDFVDTVTIGTYTAISGQINTLKTWVSMPNNVMDSLNTDDTLMVSVFSCDTALSGTYRVGNSSDAKFTDFHDFTKSALSCGVNGKVVLEVETGRYSEMDFRPFAQYKVINQNDTIMVRSLSGNASDVVFASDGNVVTLDNSKNIYLKNITIDASAGTMAGIDMLRNCDNIEIAGCVINANAITSTVASACGIRCFGDNNNYMPMGNIRIKNNTFNNGVFAIDFNYAYSDTQKYISLIGNTFNFLQTGIRAFAWGSYATQFDWIADNVFIAQPATRQQVAINMDGNSYIDSGMVRNKILFNGHNTSGAGIQLSNCKGTTTGQMALVANNEIRKISGSGTFNGLHADRNNAYICYNSIYAGGSGIARAIYFNDGISTCQNYIMHNICVAASSHATNHAIYAANVYYAQRTYGNILEDNVYYSTGANLFYAGGNINDLDTWKKTLTYQGLVNGVQVYFKNDTNSIVSQPNFMDITEDLNIYNYRDYYDSNTIALNADIRNMPRGIVSSKGAYTLPTYNLNTSVSLDDIVSLSDTVIVLPSRQMPLVAKITNRGNNRLTSATLGWSLNGIMQNNNITWNGNLQKDSSVVFQMATYTAKLNDFDTISVWVDNPNGQVDTNHFDDTLIFVVYHTPDIELVWIQKNEDTVYSTGPYHISVKARSITHQFVSNIQLMYYYTDTNNVVARAITLNMNNMGYGIWSATIPNLPFCSLVNYRVNAIDYKGNTISLSDSYYIKQENVSLSDYSVALESVVSPLQMQSLTIGSHPIKVVIRNKGRKNLTACVLAYSINGQMPITLNWTGNLPTDYVDTITLGNYNAVAGNLDMITTWVAQPNNVVDVLSDDDTLYTSVFACGNALSGIYRMGNSSTANFTTFEHFLATSQHCGINGQVVLEIEKGTYSALDLRPLASIMQSTDTLVFVAADRNAKDVVFASDTSVVTMDGNQNIYCQYLTLDATPGIGCGVNLSPQMFPTASNNIEFNHCIIRLNDTTKNLSCAGVYFETPQTYSNGTNDYSIRILNNEISGGGCGLSFYCANNNMITVRGNKIYNFYKRGIYGNYNTKFDYIADNEIISRQHEDAITGEFTGDLNTMGIFLRYSCRVDGGIERNKINMRSPGAGIVFYMTINSPSTGGKGNALIANNEIRGYCESSNINCFGMNLYSDLFDVQNNTLYYYGNAPYRGIAISSQNNFAQGNVSVENNIIVGKSTNSNFAINTTTAIWALSCIKADYNCYIGSFGSSGIATLTSWQQQTGKDLHSVTTMPIFKDTSKNLDISNYIVYKAPNTKSILQDIEGKYRGNITTMGAYDEDAVNIAYSDLQILDIPTPDELCQQTHIPVIVNIINNGLKVDFAKDSLKILVEIVGPNSYCYDTVLHNGTIAYQQQLKLQLIENMDVTIPGTYHIKIFLTCPADSILTNDTMATNHVVYRVILPWEEDFANGFPYEMRQGESNSLATWHIVQGTNAGVGSQYGNSMFAYDGSRGNISQILIRSVDFSKDYKPTLDFWYYHDTMAAYGALGDYTIVKYTLDGGITYTNLMQVKKNNGVDMGWKQYSVNMDSVIGESCVVVAFEAMRRSPATYDGTQYIDKVRFYGKQDIAIGEIITNEMTTCNQITDIDVVIENTTNQQIDFNSQPTQLEVNIIGATPQTITIALDSGVFEPLKKDTISIAKNLSLSQGNNLIVAKITPAIDDFAYNDTLSKLMDIMPSLTMRLVQVSDGNNCVPVGMKVLQSMTIENNGNMDMEDLVVVLEVSNSMGNIIETLYDTIIGILKVDSMINYTFKNTYIVPNDEQYNVKATIFPICNATLTYHASVNECINLNDIEIVEILTPVDDNMCSKVGDNIKIKVKLRNNNPNEDVRNVSLYAKVADNNQNNIGNWTESIDDISANTDIDFEFPTSFSVPNVANYTVTVYLVGNSDVNNSNDTVSVTKCTNLGIETANISGISMSQNIPNPANEKTSVDYTVPADGKVMFNIMTVTGQILYTEEVSAMAGENQVEFNTANMASGIYFYTMTYQGQRIVKKMTIEK